MEVGVHEFSHWNWGCRKWVYKPMTEQCFGGPEVCHRDNLLEMLSIWASYHYT
jgi:hypothetical protein